MAVVQNDRDDGKAEGAEIKTSVLASGMKSGKTNAMKEKQEERIRKARLEASRKRRMKAGQDKKPKTIN